MERIPASRRTSQEISERLAQLSEGDGVSELVRLGIRKIIEEALEGEVGEALGRGYYERGERAGYRNGTRRGRLRTAEGMIEYGVPQVAGREEPFRSRIRPELANRSEALEKLAVEMYARGLSTRDIEDAFRDQEGRLLLSRTVVSELTERLWAEYEAFATRDLSEYQVVYLFIDGLAERLRVSQPLESVLVAWGICSDGSKVLLHLAPGSKEDIESSRAFLEDLRRRGLNDPLLWVSDGAPGPIRAGKECFPRSLRQRCLAHKMRNLQNKVPEDQWPDFRAAARACYEAPSEQMAQVLRQDFIARYKRDFPSAAICFEEDFEACIAHLRFPVTHRKMIRTTNLLERLFGEERRRTKVIANAFGERPVLKLMYAALIRASEKWRGITMTLFEQKQLEAIRKELDDAHTRRTSPAVKSSAEKSPDRFSSKERT